MRLFNLDAHISVIADVEHIFTHLYPDVEITKWSLSGHTWVFGDNSIPVDVLNENTWDSIDHDLIAKFHKRYDNFLSLFDGFICGFPPVFSLLFEKYNKPIFMVNATRYEMPFHLKPNPSMKRFFEERLLAMQEKGQLIAVSNNKGDREYLHEATGVNSLHIPSLCKYTNAEYAPTKKEFILFSKQKINAIEGLLPYKTLGRYSWEELYSYQGFVHLPYEISTMSIFEHYSANVPLFMPSPRLLKDLLRRRRIRFNGPYTRANFPENLEPMLGSEWVDFWVDRADYYDQENMPFITYYDSLHDVPDLIANADLDMLHKQMKSHNKKRQAKVLSQWRDITESHFLKSKPAQVLSNGQINMGSKFGKIINAVSAIKEFNSFLEIGTWNGEGSTACVMNALMKRNDTSRLFSIELMPEMYLKAKQFWSWLESSQYAHQLVLLNGKVIEKGILTAQEVESHPAFEKVKRHYELYYKSDVNFFESAKNVSDQLPDQIDVALLDGGEFCSFAEFEYVLKELNPKVFILDDTAIIKCSAAREQLLSDNTWHVYYDDLTDRHGAAVFVQKEYANLLPSLEGVLSV